MNNIDWKKIIEVALAAAVMAALEYLMSIFKKQQSGDNSNSGGNAATRGRVSNRAHESNQENT